MTPLRRAAGTDQQDGAHQRHCFADEIAHQARAIGIVAGDALVVHEQSMDGPAPRGALAQRTRHTAGADLVWHCGDGLAAAPPEIHDKDRQVCGAHIVQPIDHVLAGLLGEEAVYERGAAV